MHTPSLLHRLPGAALGAVMATLLSGAALASEVVTRQEFPVTPGGRLILDADRGSITVTPGATQAVGLTVTRELKGASAAKTEEALAQHPIDCVQDGNTVRIHAHSREGSLAFWRRNSLRVRYEVTVPRKFDLQLKTAGGGITVGDITGQVELSTAGGSLTTGTIDGSLKARTSGGSIRADGVTGNVEAGTAGGSIHLGDMGGDVHAETSGGSIRIASAVGAVDAETAGGSIELSRLSGAAHAETSGGSITAAFAASPSKDSVLETSGGSITVLLPESASCAVDARTSGGSVSNELPVTTRRRESKSEFQGDLGSGGSTLKLRTSGGGIRLKALAATP